MKPSADVARLAAKMSALRDEVPSRTLPFLIGDLCGERAGVPSPVEIGRATIGSLFDQSPDLAAELLPAGRDAPDDDVEAAFLGWLGKMTHLQRYRVLEPFYRRVPVPLFYQDLADLIVSGFVTHVLTTNVDTLLEQALDGRGLTAGRDYGVQVVGCIDPTPAPTEPTTTTIVKLYGDLGQQQLAMDPQEIDRVLTENRSFVKTELAAELVVVGHQIDLDQPRAIDEWLARGSGEIWWVHPEPDADVLAPIGASRGVTQLTGEQGDPEAFFGQLNLHLIRMPAAAILAPSEARRGDSFEQVFLKSRIEKAQVSKYSFEQNATPGDENAGLQAQLGYLSDTAASYGSQLRDLAPIDPGGILARLVDEATDADVEQSTIDFLAQQATIVERELASASPNQLLVSGAISAASSVAQGLGPQLSSGLTDDLRSAAAAYTVGPS
jgi:SIR2-like protein